jgi:DNA replication protein DnaC
VSPASARTSSSDPSAYQRLRDHLAYLEMSAAAKHLADELDRGTREQASATQVLERLMAIEADATRARRLRGRLRFARYPIHKTLAEFDLDFQPSLDRKVLAELSTLRFVEPRRNVILLGHRASACASRAAAPFDSERS